MSRSRLSAWRTSPTMIRDGRIRSASLTSRRSGISPVPSRRGCRHCIDGDVAVRDAQLEDLLARDDPLPRGDGRGQAVEQRRLAGLRAAGDEDVEPGRDRRLEEARRLPGERAEPRPGRRVESRLDDELADVDAPVVAGDVRDHDVQPAAVGQHRVDERRADRSTRRPEDFSIRSTRSRTWSCDEQRGGQLGDPWRATNTRAGLVDPDLLDRRVVEVLLQRAEARRPCPTPRGTRRVDVGEHRHPAAHRPLVVVGDGLGHQPAHLALVARRVEARATDQLTHLALERVDGIHGSLLPRPDPSADQRPLGNSEPDVATFSHPRDADLWITRPRRRSVFLRWRPWR